MIVLKQELKHGRVSVQVQNLDDLWYLSHIIGLGDEVTGKTTRKVRMGSSEEAVKKSYTLAITVEEVEFKNQALRVSGITTEPKEDIPKGSHHTISAEPGDVITIIKEGWPKYQLARLEAATQEQLKALIVVFDRESCILARLISSGYEIIGELKGKVKKKGYDTPAVNFYREIISSIKEYDERKKPDQIILASPAFWKEEMMNEIERDSESIRKKIVLATCSSVSTNAIDEVMKRPEMETVFKSAIAAKELKLIDEVMTAIAREGKVAYGKKEVEKAIEAAAVEKLIVTDSTIYAQKTAESLMKQTEENGGKVFIINSENEAGEKLNALGGMAALLRYRLQL